MTDTSHITVGPRGVTSFVGPDAVNLYRARCLASGLRLYAATGMKVTRTATLTVMLKMATHYTGRSYGRSRRMAAVAAADVTVWADEMAAALPVIRD